MAPPADGPHAPLLGPFAEALDAALEAAIARACRDAPQRAGEAQRTARNQRRERRDAARAVLTAAQQDLQAALDASRQAERTLLQAASEQVQAVGAFHRAEGAVMAWRAEALELMAPVLVARAAAEAAVASAEAALAAEQTLLDELEASPELQALERAEQASFDARIAELGRTLGQPRWTTPALEHTPDATAAIAALGRPRPLKSADDVAAEAARLTAAIARRDAWPALSMTTQTLLLAHLAARLRALQEQPEPPRGLRPLFSKLTAWSAAHRPGFVHGLAQAHAPLNGTWLADAERTWDALQPAAAAPQPASAPSATSRKRRETPADPLPADPLPEDWPWRDRLRDARVLLLGSDITQDQLALLRTTFGFATLDHTTGHKDRRVQASQTAITTGRYDLVIIVSRWLNHQASKSIVHACKAACVTIVQADGYGISTLKAAFEGKLAPDVDG